MSACITPLLHPLRRLADAATFFLSAAAYPIGTPDRALRILQRLPVPLPGAEQLIRNLLDRLAASVPAQNVIAQLPLAEQSVFVPQIERCIACDAPLVIAYPRRPNHPAVYTTSGAVGGVQLFAKRCQRDNCRALHYMSYAVGVGDSGNLPDGKQLPYSEEQMGRWWQVTPCVVWEIKLLEQYQAQLLHSHTGMETFIKEYEQVHRCCLPVNTRLRLQLGFFSWSLVLWLRESALSVHAMNMSSAEALDGHLLECMPTLAQAFVKMWGVDHAKHCRQPDGSGRTCVCWTMDGHMKCKRPVCMNKFARAFDCGRLGTAVLGCTRSPVVGSKFCAECREAGARSAIELKGAQEVTSIGISVGAQAREAAVRRSPRLAEAGLTHLASELEIDAGCKHRNPGAVALAPLAPSTAHAFAHASRDVGGVGLLLQPGEHHRSRAHQAGSSCWKATG